MTGVISLTLFSVVKALLNLSNSYVVRRRWCRQLVVVPWTGCRMVVVWYVRSVAQCVYAKLRFTCARLYGNMIGI